MTDESAEDLYEHAPCGYLSTLPDGRIVRANTTLLRWLGRTREELLGRRFADLLTVGGRIYHETHFAPLLRMQQGVNGIALELVTATGDRLPVLATSTVRGGHVRTTLVNAQDRRAYERELLRARQEADRERERVQQLATTLQRTLLPPLLPRVPGLTVAAYYHHASADLVGGDFYDLFQLADGRWGLFLGDVCGKGATAAAVTSLTRYTLRSASVYDPRPEVVLRNLNSVLGQQHQGDGPRFCTVLFGLLTPTGDGAELVLASGGHPPVLLLGADGGAEYLPTPGGQPVGILPEPVITTRTIHLGPGDTLLLYTDGLTEARVGPTNQYSEQDLLDFADARAPTTPAGLVEALTGLLADFGDGLRDDVALLALGVPNRS